MKSWLIGALIVLCVMVPAFASSYEDMDQEGVSLKAGPTDVTEELSLAWVEAALYPKTIEKGREVFLEVRLASPVKIVKLNLDTEKGSLPLFSEDNKNWSRVVKVSPGAISGLHVARVTIVGSDDRSIQRNLDFIVKDESRAEKEIPLIVLSVTQVVDNGEIVKQLLPGYKLTALYRAPFYRVKLEDGKEGWIEASRVKEPTEELYLLGYRAFENKNYAEAISNFKQVLEYDPENPRTHLFLARIYMKQNKIDQAADEVKDVLAQEPDNAAAKDLANTLAARYMEVKDYSRVFELKPQLLVARLNEKVKEKEKIVIEARVVKKAEKKIAAVPAPAPAVPKEILADSIGLVKLAKTSKGSSVSSAISSVLSLTKSLGTKIYEDGWRVVAASDGLRVIYACRQERGGKLENENFEWKINQDTKSATPLNENARVLMNRW